MRFDLEGRPTGRGTLRDTYLRGIYDSRGRYISGTRNDDGGVGANSRVIFSARRSGYYYVAAGGYGSRTGSYRLTARALSGGGGYGYRRPDLVVTSGYAYGNFRAGGRVYANVTVRNQGSASTGRSSYVGYYLSTNSTITTSDTRLDYDYVSSLRAGRNSYEYESFYLPRNLVAGRTYYIGAIADYSGRVSESNEYNNARVLRSFTVPLPSRPDLIVSSLYTNKTTYTAGETIRITSTTRNAGNASAGSSYTKFYLSRDRYLSSSDTYLGYDYVSGLSRGYSRSDTVTGRLGVNLSGSYYIIAKADANGWRSESNEYNNIRVSNRINIVRARPDLTITSLGTDKTRYTAGESIRITATTKNIGNASAGSSYTKFYLSRDTSLGGSDIYLGDDYVSSLGAGSWSRDTVTKTLSSSLSGNYYLIAKADATNRVSESNGNNNLVRTLGSIRIDPSRPDLTITSLGTDKTRYTAGESIRITATTKNIGNASAGSSYTKFYLSRDTSLGSSDIQLRTDSVSGLNAGSWFTRTATANLGSNLSGSYYLIAKADATGRVSESNEGNNIRVIGNPLYIEKPRSNLPERYVVDNVFETERDFRFGGKEWSLIKPFNVNRNKSFNKPWNGGVAHAYIKGKAWADFTAGLDIGFNLGSISGTSNLDTKLKMAMPSAIRAGERFTIDTSKWKYDVTNSAGFELNDSKWRLTAEAILAGSVGMELEVGAGLNLGLFKPKISSSVKLQRNENVKLDFLGMRDVKLGGWELSASGQRLAIEKGSREFSLNAPNLEGVESEREGLSFKAERDAEDNLVNANLDLMNALTKLVPQLKPLNVEKTLFDKKIFGKQFKAEIEAKLISLDLNGGVGYSEDINLDYDPRKMNLKLTFGNQTRTGKWGSKFSFLAPTDKSVKNLRVDFGYNSRLEAKRDLNFNAGLTLGVGTLNAELKAGDWRPELNAGPVFSASTRISSPNIGITKPSTSLAFKDTTNIAMAYV
uniref:Serine protease, subtilase family n=1 Tax=Candidatus Kentrum sp. TC TaxID=2126339 RepID=A0A450YNQ4_9GAMM|nr:MAG: Serine protease, subtilase family [Candidatus Kentron sp. TC]